MSDLHRLPEHDLPHEGPIKTPKQLVIVLVASFVLPVVLILMLVNFVVSSTRPAAGSDMSEAAVSRRIAPIGTVEVKDVSDPASLASGQQVYTAQCAACHATGAAGAPKLGDAAAWEPRLKTGYEALLTSALKGKGSMPAQGGEFSDFEIGRAVVYIANQSGGKLAEPAPPAGTAAAGAAAGGTAAAASAPASAPK